MIIIATKELIKKVPEFQHDILAEANKLEKFQKNVLKIKNLKEKIKIYDIGKIHRKDQKLMRIKDHINKTGINPIINNKHINQITFQDISVIYNTDQGRTTTCCGEEINVSYTNPSHYLCVFSILLFYLDYKNLQAYLVEYDKM